MNVWVRVRVRVRVMVGVRVGVRVRVMGRVWVEDRVGPRTWPNPRTPSFSMPLGCLVAKTWKIDPGGRFSRIADTCDAFIQAANIVFRRVH